jgi:hypothetical protein
MKKMSFYQKVSGAIVALKKKELSEKIDAAIDVLKKADPKTKLPGTLLDKAHDKGLSIAPAAPPKRAPKIKAPEAPKSPNLKLSEEMGKCWKSETGTKFLKYVKSCAMKKSWGLKKDDKPHKPGTPEHAAHEIAEHGDSIREHAQKMPAKEAKEMMEHLRTLKDPSQRRSPHNKK